MDDRPQNLDFDEKSPAEVWGRRVGRTLGWIVAVGLFVNLLTRWFF